MSLLVVTAVDVSSLEGQTEIKTIVQNSLTGIADVRRLYNNPPTSSSDVILRNSENTTGHS